MKTVDHITDPNSGYRFDASKNAYMVDPALQSSLQSRFVSRVSLLAEEFDWTTQMIPAEARPYATILPGISVVPPHQKSRTFLCGYQLEAGIPAKIDALEWSDETLKRSIGFYLLKFRTGLDMLDVIMPTIMSSEHLVTFRNNEPTPCDPERWADMAMRFSQELWERQKNDTGKRTLL